MSNTKTELTKKSQATKPKTLNIDVEEEFSNLYISNNKFKRGIRRIAYGVHDKFSKENKWGKRPTVEQIDTINKRIDTIKENFKTLQTLYNNKIEEIEKLENNPDYQELINKSRNKETDDNNKILQEISSRFIYAKKCISDVLNYIQGLPQSVEEMLSWREYHQQRKTWSGRFARQVHTYRTWGNRELQSIHTSQAAYIAAANMAASAVQVRENDTSTQRNIKTITAAAGTAVYVGIGKAEEDQKKIREGEAAAEQINKDTYEKYFKPVLDMKKDFESLETDKKNRQETYKELKTKAEKDYHILPTKSLENMTRILYQVSSTVDALIKEIRDNYGTRLDKGFFMSTKKKEEKLNSIEKNIEKCTTLLGEDFESKVQEFNNRINTLETKIENNMELSESAKTEIEELSAFCEKVTKNLGEFKTANDELVTHINKASKSIYYAYTVSRPISGLILRPEKFPKSPEIKLNEL